ncbi:ubiquitin-specific protease doa4 [Lunasporangiospora selenospora]|uniref:ubiquitinyl hydrolase 1 n=1 Tax=Lunasporangiospora selenospora TaxID=979761 RepID=A0A9P6G264_9FUNG|nr:ubiquitin-specific protease doa4 [Lunasporangiospora selenospora]
MELPKDKEFEKLKTDPEYIAVKKRIVDLLPDTEKLKELLQRKYQSIQDIETSALATAAKTARPKPPPRPTKPDFLRHDGQPPAIVSNMSSLSINPTNVPVTSVTTAPSFPNPTAFRADYSLELQRGVTTPVNGGSSLPPSAPLPTTSLASFVPLMPTAYGAGTTSATSGSAPPNTTRFMPGPRYDAQYSAPFTPSAPILTLPPPPPSPPITPKPTAQPAQPAQTTPRAGFGAGHGEDGAERQCKVPSPVPAPRPAHSLIPPASAPAAMTKGNNKDEVNGIADPNSQSPMTSMTTPSNDDYKQPLFVKPQRLLDYMRQPKPPSILFIDVRMQIQYGSARIKAKSIMNIEPVALRDGMTAKTLYEQGLFSNPPSERAAFNDRANFDLVIYYDQTSTERPTQGPLYNLFRALSDLEFERPLKRKPVLLSGGFDAWLDCSGMGWVEGVDVDVARRTHQSTPTSLDSDSTSDYSAQVNPIFNKISRGGGINRHDGRIIRRNIGDYINRDDGPESMVNPKIPLPLSNVAYPPTATPYSNVSISSPQPSPHFPYANSNHTNWGTGSMSNQASSTLGSVNALQRRMTIYDSHWNNFGAPEKPFSPTSTITAPQIPDKIPIPGAGMSINGELIPASSTSPMLHQPFIPTSTFRPVIPAKPMRPLPQPPAMNDLRGYTQFGSGFSKIGTTQLGKTGLTNLGNTCFMNSVIQCLIATPPLSRFFLDGSYKRYINMRNIHGTKGKLAEAFSDLIRGMWSGQSLVVSPTSFRYAIVEFAPQFKGTEQHDSQEFLSFLLDGLHEDLKRESQPPPPGDDEGSEADEARMETLPDYEASHIAWTRYLRRDDSIVVSLFQGQFKNRMCCTKCGKTSTTYNSFMYLALPIKAKRHPTQSLVSCLNAFVEPEILEGENAWNCPRCKKPRKATKQMTISRVPDVLLIQLKRFSSDGPFKNKIKAMVQYPIQNLDLTRYLPKRTIMNNAGVATTIQETALYDLYAVSNHSGEVSSGHYTACVRGETPDSWTNFDDTRVSPCDKSVAVSEHGYTLFYVRKK